MIWFIRVSIRLSVLLIYSHTRTSYLLLLLYSRNSTSAMTVMRATVVHPLASAPVVGSRSISTLGFFAPPSYLKLTAFPTRVSKKLMVTRATLFVEQEDKKKVSLIKIGTRGRFIYLFILNSSVWCELVELVVSWIFNSDVFLKFGYLV